MLYSACLRKQEGRQLAICVSEHATNVLWKCVFWGMLNIAIINAYILGDSAKSPSQKHQTLVPEGVQNAACAFTF